MGGGLSWLSDEDHPTVYATDLALATMYALTAGVALVELLRTMVYTIRASLTSEVAAAWRIQKIFLTLLVFQAVCRFFFFIYFGLSGAGAIGDVVPTAVILISDQLPSTLFFCAYSVLVCWWAMVYHFKTSSIRLAQVVAVLVNIALFCTFAIVFSLYVVKAIPDNYIIMAGRIIFALYSVFFALAVGLYGCAASLLQSGREKKVSVSYKYQFGNRTSRPVVFVCTASFAFRALLLAILVAWEDFSFFFKILYFGVCEGLPDVLMLWAFRHASAPEVTPERVQLFTPINSGKGTSLRAVAQQSTIKAADMEATFEHPLNMQRSPLDAPFDTSIHGSDTGGAAKWLKGRFGTPKRKKQHDRYQGLAGSYSYEVASDMSDC